MSNIIRTQQETSPYDPCIGRPYNRYNIYYILERERFLQSHTSYNAAAASEAAANNEESSHSVITGYENLAMPGLPPRYAHIYLAHDWHMPGKRKAARRKHKKSHGIASFQHIAQVVAAGWRAIDDVTLEYCTEVARILKDRHEVLKQMGGLGCFDIASGSGDGSTGSTDVVSNRNKKTEEDGRSEMNITTPIFKTHNESDLQSNHSQLQRWFPIGAIMPTRSDFMMRSLSSTNDLSTNNLSSTNDASAETALHGSEAFGTATITGYMPNASFSSKSFHMHVSNDIATTIMVPQRGSYQSFFSDNIKQNEANLKSLPSMSCLDSKTVHDEVDMSDQDIISMWHGE